MIKSSLFRLLVIGLAVAAFSSCASTRPLQYLQGSFDTAALSHYTIPEPVIQENDLLSIVVYSDNPTATAIYNQPLTGGGGVPASVTGSGGSASGSGPSSQGYLVDDKGNIQFQGIGSLHVAGLTRAQLRDTINNRIGSFLTNPYYVIRFLNYRITVIGDVAHPAVFSIPTERVNLLEALGLAGDLNVSARRDNVLVIRERNGKREFGRIDLTKPDIFKSPFYQLQQNDIVYIDLTKNKAASNDQVTIRNIGIATSIITTVALIITVLKR